MAGKQAMIFALDDTDHSFYALEWTLDHFFVTDSLFKLVIVHVKTTPTSVIGLAGPGTSDVLMLVETDIKKTAQRVCEKAKQLCNAKGVTDVEFDVVEGDARNVLCDAVDKHHASVLVMGSHGYGAFKRAVLGSVSDYCSHHARCSVMIVKKPKTKN
ncbi:universal stress protein PHOS34-like [Nicotiana tabacum]|uniref:Universal stress protein A-like protein n=1 Tax=Nicotiana tabacum TaxID=4097 RepID=A0A1S4CG57_TOBAC|nr:universal stress protein PHOS34-like [Nicotiana tomentosiformis]XP_016500167.1 PREDICTED: universal stress protein A-like protein [Nicotiana tabacum]